MASNNITLDTQPRVNGELLGQLQTGKEVIFLGSLERKDGDGRCTFLSADKKEVTVVFNGDVPPTKFVEVIGKVNGDKSITASTFVALGDSFDLDAYNDAIRLLPIFTGLY